MRKNALKKENAELREQVALLKRANFALGREIGALRRANLALVEEVNIRQDKIDAAVRLCQVKIRQKEGIPAWLKEVMRDA